MIDFGLPSKFNFTNIRLLPGNNSVIYVKDIKNLLLFFSYANFLGLRDMTATDFLQVPRRFLLSYNFSNFRDKTRCYIHVPSSNLSKSVDTFFACANWLEREIYDTFGIIFEGSRDLRRILTDYGYSSFCLRKDYPISGYKELYYDLEKNSLSYRPAFFTQLSRQNEVVSPFVGNPKPFTYSENQYFFMVSEHNELLVLKDYLLEGFGYVLDEDLFEVTDLEIYPELYPEFFNNIKSSIKLRASTVNDFFGKVLEIYTDNYLCSTFFFYC